MFKKPRKFFLVLALVLAIVLIAFFFFHIRRLQQLKSEGTNSLLNSKLEQRLDDFQASFLEMKKQIVGLDVSKDRSSNDGQNGDDGQDGNDGQNGDDGQDGSDGEDGLNGISSDYIVTVGQSGSGATYEVDNQADQVEIQAAIDTVAASGGGVIKILKGVYNIEETIVMPKDSKITLEGEYVTKTGYGGTTIKASSSLSENLEALVYEAGELNALDSNADHSHASRYSQLIFDGNAKADVGLLLYNTDHTMVNDCKFVNTAYGIDAQFNGDVASSDYAGGLRIERSSFYSSNTNLRLNSHTQDWISDSWFLGTPTTHIHFIKSNKIHLSNNEFNTVDGQVFIFDDDSELHCGDINITGGFIDAGQNKYFWQDNRSHASSKGIVVAGVRMVRGVKSLLFNQDKDYQASTYDASDLSGGYIYPDYNDDVILMNSNDADLSLRFPSATTAVKEILVKAIDLDHEIVIYPQPSQFIEANGTLGASFSFSELNESVWFVADGDKWRVVAHYLPTGTGASSDPDRVIEVSSSTYNISLDDDYLLVNAYNNSVTLTLPLKATKYAEDRKIIVVKVINASNPVTIQAGGSDQIDNVGQINVVLNDTSAITFIANSGSRWRTY